MFITESAYETSCFWGFQFDTRLLVDKVLEQKFLIAGAKEGAKQMINEATVPNLKEDQVKRWEEEMLTRLTESALLSA